MARHRTLVAMAALLIATATHAWAPDASARGSFGKNILSIDHYVDHVSTSPAIAGMPIKLFVRERVLAGVARGGNIEATGKAVLFVHGGTYPSVPDFDLEYKDYSWMAYLAQAGFDVYAMDITGYGKSSRPFMDDPCNTNPAQQAIIIPSPLPAPCPPSFPFRLTTTVSEWDDMNAVVDFIRARTGVEAVHLIGWSGGGPRIGGYAALYPEKVGKIVILAPGYSRLTPDQPTLPLPTPGFPMNLSTRTRAFNERWDIQVQCPGQFEPAIRDVIWASNMEFDPVGATWGPQVVRQRTSTSWGWNAKMAAQVKAPALLLSGELDQEVLPIRVRELYEDLGSTSKVLMNMECTSHYTPYETQYKVMHKASKDWLLHGSVIGVSRGELRADATGKVRKVGQ